MIDSSALVSLLASEVDGERFAAAIEDASEATTHSIAIWETALALSRIRKIRPAEAFLIVSDFLSRAGVEAQSVSVNHSLLAVEAFERYGKGTRHPAQLNMGDCFSYAVARHSGLKLLYKGDDFARTDLA